MTSNRPARLDASQLAPGTLYTLLAAAGFGAVSILTTLALATGVTLSTVLAWRYTLAAVVLVVFVGSQQYKRIPPNEMLRFVTIGGFGQALLVYLALSSLAYIPAATLAFLFYTYPAWVALVQSVRGAERLDVRRAAALGLSFAGIVVMVGLPGGIGATRRPPTASSGAASRSRSPRRWSTARTSPSCASCRRTTPSRRRRRTRRSARRSRSSC